MGGLFGGKPKAVRPPPVPPPQAIPEVGPEPGEMAIRRARRRRGYEGTIITGALQAPARKKTVLG